MSVKVGVESYDTYYIVNSTICKYNIIIIFGIKYHSKVVILKMSFRKNLAFVLSLECLDVCKALCSLYITTNYYYFSISRDCLRSTVVFSVFCIMYLVSKPFSE